MKTFNFGRNWQNYSKNVLSAQHIAGARVHFDELFEGIPLKEKSFFDVGYGQGLIPFLAAEQGALVSGIDISPESLASAKVTAQQFPHVSFPKLSVGSILDPVLKNKLKEQGGYDIVHSWGVLHHTGDLDAAIEICKNLVKPGGFLVLAIYNRHISSPAWKLIKFLYNILPSLGQRVLVGIFGIILYPLVKRTYRDSEYPRGMDFHYDLIDWLGGYPYEYRSKEDISKLVGEEFKLLKIFEPKIPTGNNEFVFAR